MKTITFFIRFVYIFWKASQIRDKRKNYRFQFGNSIKQLKTEPDNQVDFL